MSIVEKCHRKVPGQSAKRTTVAPRDRRRRGTQRRTYQDCGGNRPELAHSRSARVIGSGPIAVNGGCSCNAPTITTARPLPPTACCGRGYCIAPHFQMDHDRGHERRSERRQDLDRDQSRAFHGAGEEREDRAPRPGHAQSQHIPHARRQSARELRQYLEQGTHGTSCSSPCTAIT